MSQSFQHICHEGKYGSVETLLKYLQNKQIFFRDTKQSVEQGGLAASVYADVNEPVVVNTYRTKKGFSHLEAFDLQQKEKALIFATTQNMLRMVVAPLNQNNYLFGKSSGPDPLITDTPHQAEYRLAVARNHAHNLPKRKI